jgi:uncharacterized repeat protein (TIGR03806 family)
MFAFVVRVVLLGLGGVFSAEALERVPNGTLNLPSTPPQSGYATTPAFSGVVFTNPCVVVAPPGETNRLFVVEQRGFVAVITNLAAPNRTTFLNISGQVLGGVPNDERGLLGLAFHPGYATNGFFYVFYSGTTTSTNPSGTLNSGMHQIVSRYSVSAGNSNAANAASELRLLAMFDRANNHNGGCLQFGPDGYLYIATGDEGGSNDQYNNSQTITNDLWAGMLRIDVDNRPGNLLPPPHHSHRFAGWNGAVNFRVPADNPFVGATEFNGWVLNTNLVRTEFWATGLRNPWRFSFDPLTGALYCGDVGQGQSEEISVLERGGNYGWAYREGFLDGFKVASTPPGFVGRQPIIGYLRGSATNQGFAVTGGVVYRGNRFAGLTGKYLFADYVSGHIWAATPNGTNQVGFQWLTTDAGIAAFGYDPRNGDVLLCDQGEDAIKRLVATTNVNGPATLAATGAFADVGTLTPAAGVVPYDVNVPFWSDNATKQRWLSVPATNQAITFSAEGNWLFPTGTVWVKHFELVTNTVTQATRRLETRLLVRYTNGVYGLTYRWTTPPTNALLVAEEGLQEAIVVNDNSVLRTQTWIYPGRGECLSCHTPASGGVLGFNTLQLNRTVLDGGTPTNQLATLSGAGYFTAPISNVNSFRALAHPTNEAASLEWRARSYLAVNCASCHQPEGTTASWDGRSQTPTRLANIVNGLPANNGGNPAARIVAPGATNLSLIHNRIRTRGVGAMPPVGSTLVDTGAVALLTRWITADLTNYQSYADWQLARFGSTNAPSTGEQEDFDFDGARNLLEYLTATDPLSPASKWGLDIARPGQVANVSWTQPANRAVVLEQTATVGAPGSWQPVPAAWNEPTYGASNAVRQFTAPPQAPFVPQFYRARVIEP